MSSASSLATMSDLGVTKLQTLNSNSPNITSIPSVPMIKTESNQTIISGRTDMGTSVQNQTASGATAPAAAGAPHRYMKIQPAIAIKPKPIPIAMLPKPAATVTTKFDPSPSVKSSIQLNVNTLKKWVLPPRPRPGRKPTTSSSSLPHEETNEILPSTSSDFLLGKNSPKKKQRTKKEDEIKAQIINQLNQQFPRKKVPSTSPSISNNVSSPVNLSSMSLNGDPHNNADIKLSETITASSVTLNTVISNTNNRSSNMDTTPTATNSNINSTYSVHQNQSATNTPGSSSISGLTSDTFMVPKAQPDAEAKHSIRNLKTYYCNLIKEQQLVQNYIEVLSKQIKELRFVQNGVITVDALMEEKTNNQFPLLKPTSAATTTTTPPAVVQCEQLEKINNINDLNKFLGYLTKSSNIIHSVTKNYSGSKEENLDSQIKTYLEQKKTNRTVGNAVGIHTNDNTMRSSNNMKQPQLLPKTNMIRNKRNHVNSNKKNSGVLQSIQEYKGPELDLMEDIPFTDDVSLFTIDEFDDYVLVDANNIQEEKKSATTRSNGCGFCGNGTPCLCLDSDIEIRKIRQD